MRVLILGDESRDGLTFDDWPNTLTVEREHAEMAVGVVRGPLVAVAHLLAKADTLPVVHLRGLFVSEHADSLAKAVKLDNFDAARFLRAMSGDLLIENARAYPALTALRFGYDPWHADVLMDVTRDGRPEERMRMLPRLLAFAGYINLSGTQYWHRVIGRPR